MYDSRGGSVTLPEFVIQSGAKRNRGIFRPDDGAANGTSRMPCPTGFCTFYQICHSEEVQRTDVGISRYDVCSCIAGRWMLPGDCTTGIPFGPTVAMLPRNDISGSAFVNPPGLSFRPRRSRVEESSGLTMVRPTASLTCRNMLRIRPNQCEYVNSMCRAVNNRPYNVF